MYLKIQGLVLRRTEYNDHDVLLTILSKEHGKITAKARGLKRKNSPLTAQCQLLAFSAKRSVIRGKLGGKWEITFISKWDFIINAVLVTLSNLGKTSTSISLSTSSTGLTCKLSGKLPQPSFTALKSVPVVISSAAQFAFFFMLNIFAYMRLDFCHILQGLVVGGAWNVLIDGGS